MPISETSRRSTRETEKSMMKAKNKNEKKRDDIRSQHERAKSERVKSQDSSIELYPYIPLSLPGEERSGLHIGSAL
jgi:hypothetical protein